MSRVFFTTPGLVLFLKHDVMEQQFCEKKQDTRESKIAQFSENSNVDELNGVFADSKAREL
eukprot:314626-Pyramimonas_sp.AAC.1